MKESSLKSISVLIVEGDSNMLAFIVNCLSQVRKIKIYIISYNKNSNVRHYSRVANFSYYSKVNTEIDWILNINKELQKHKIDIVLPIDDYGIRAAIKYRKNIFDPKKVVALSSLESFNIAFNKTLLAQHLIKNNITCPNTFFYSKEKLLENAINEYPVLLKPSDGFSGGKGIIKFNNFEEVKNYLFENQFNHDFVIQEFIEGYDLGCNVLATNGEINAFTIQKGYLWSDLPFSPQIGLVFLYEQEIYDLISKLIKSLNWSGVANIDLRYDKNDRQFKIIEMNPRFWETTEASEIAGVNFPYLQILKSLNVDFEIPIYNHLKYLNLLGLKKTIKENKLFAFRFKFILKNTPIKYYIKDPKPLLFIFLDKVKSILR